jgi:hypothetical protein
MATLNNHETTIYFGRLSIVIIINYGFKTYSETVDDF